MILCWDNAWLWSYMIKNVLYADYRDNQGNMTCSAMIYIFQHLLGSAVADVLMKWVQCIAQILPEDDRSIQCQYLESYFLISHQHPADILKHFLHHSSVFNKYVALQTNCCGKADVRKYVSNIQISFYWSDSWSWGAWWIWGGEDDEIERMDFNNETLGHRNYFTN